MKKNSAIALILSSMVSAGIWLSSGSLYAQGQKEQQHTGTRNSGYVFLPIVSYSPETKLAGGVFLNYYFREPDADPGSRPSNLMPTFMYTQKQQISIEMPIELYWHNELYYLSGYIGYAKFPDRMYGIGNDTKKADKETYTPRIFRIRSNIQRKITSDIYAGIQYNVKYHKVLTSEKGGSLAGRGIAGSRAGTASGLGVSITRDTRNSVFFPTDGALIKLLVQQYDSFWGSDYEFITMSADIRGYAEPFTSHVIAVNGYVHVMTGTPPFHLLSLLGQVGERNLLRGCYQGRYRDNNIIVLQAEYRVPIWWRFGLAAFGGFGDVSGSIGDFSLHSLKYTCGLGLRFQLNPEEKLHVRLDFGFGKESSGLYLAIGEAF